jgi:hypothetical protein
MGRRHRTALDLAALLLALAAPAGLIPACHVSLAAGNDRHPAPLPSAPPARSLSVALANRSHVHQAVLDLAIAEVTRVWRPYGVALVWSAEQADGQHTGPSVEVRDSVQLAGPGFVAGGAEPSRSIPALASITFVRPCVPGSTIRVSVEHAKRLLARVRTAGAALDRRPSSASDLLLARTIGRSIAHELGHYVLRSPGHSRRGLMRPIFPAGDMLLASLERFALAPEQVDVIRGGRAPACP